MKEIIISIHPQWIKEIFYNNKIIELRRNYPKCQLPLKAYIYCTKNGEKLEINNNICNGYIVGEIIINNIYNINIKEDILFINNKEREWCKLENFSKVNKEAIKEYFKDKGFGWQISQFKIYNKNKNVEDLLGKNYDRKRLMSWTILK